MVAVDPKPNPGILGGGIEDTYSQLGEIFHNHSTYLA